MQFGIMNVRDSFCGHPKFSLTPKVLSLKSCLHQCVDIFEDLKTGIDHLCVAADTYRAELISHKETCNSKLCPGSEAIKQEMFAKENIIRAAVSYLKNLSCNKNSNSFGELLKILQGEPVSLTPPKDPHARSTETSNLKVKTEVNTPIAKEKLTPKRDLSSSLEDVSFKEDSVSEIDATPTGKRSPVLQPRKSKNITSVNATDSREKKKCPNEWSSPKPKMTKIKFEGCTPVKVGRGRGRGRSRQARLPWTAVKPSSVVDLTASPEFGKGSRTFENADIQKLIKKESSENDDTILPSPTSGPTSHLFGSSGSREKSEFRRPLSLKPRSDKSILTENKQIKIEENKEIEDMEVSINILQPVRLAKLYKQSPIKVKREVDDVTACDSLASVSLLQEIERMETDQENIHRAVHVSPKKQPLAENINAGNVPSAVCDVESSMSILDSNAGAGTNMAADTSTKMAADTSTKMAADSSTKKTPEKVEPVYKEPTVRKRAEKMALPGWVCDECKNFFGALYKDDPDMVEKAVARCSKHRGRSDPARPKTPPGYWQPRWTVPDDTEEFNRRNNAQ